MKKFLLLLLLSITIFSVSAGDVNIVNSVYPTDYSFSIVHENNNNERVIVSTGFEIDEIIVLDLLNQVQRTRPFYINRSRGNKEQVEQVMVSVLPENFRDMNGVLQDFYPSVELYNGAIAFGDSSYIGFSPIGINNNGLQFGISIPAVVHDTPEDIGAFVIYYDASAFNIDTIPAGLFTSDIEINITVD